MSQILKEKISEILYVFSTVQETEAAILKENGIPVINLDLTENILGAWSGCLEVRRIIKDKKIDLVHTDGFWGNLVGRFSAKTLRVPVVSTCGKTVSLKDRFRASPSVLRWKLRLVWLYSAFTARHFVDRHVAISEAVKESLVHHWRVAEDRIEVVYRGVSLYEIPRENGSSREVDDLGQFGFEGGSPFLVTVGRLVPQKGHDRLLDAMGILARHYPEFRLLIIGEGRERLSLEKKIRESRLRRQRLPGRPS